MKKKFILGVGLVGGMFGAGTLVGSETFASDLDSSKVASSLENFAKENNEKIETSYEAKTTDKKEAGTKEKSISIDKKDTNYETKATNNVVEKTIEKSTKESSENKHSELSVKEERKLDAEKVSVKEERKLDTEKTSVKEEEKLDIEKVSTKEENSSTEAKKEKTTTLILEAKDKETLRKDLINLGAKIKYEYDTVFNGFSVEISQDKVEELTKLSSLNKFEVNAKLTRSIMNAKKITNVIRAREKYKVDGRGLVVAVIDSGVDVSHKDMRLDEGVVPKIKEITKDYDSKFTLKVPHGFNYTGGNYDVKDEYDEEPHGMHIAGILAANATDEEVANHTGIDGIAPNAQILAYKIFSNSRTSENSVSSGSDSTYAAIEDAIKHGADVISLSIGERGTGGEGDFFNNILKKTRELGIVVVAAMGNYATSSSDTSYDDYADDVLGNVDNSSAVSVAANKNSIGAASSQNGATYVKALEIGDKKIPFITVGKSFDNLYENGKFTLVYGGTGTLDELKKVNVENKVVLLTRGSDDLTDKLKRVESLGGKGILLINSNVGYNRDNYMEHLPTDYEYSRENKQTWYLGITGRDGESLLSALGTTLAENKVGVEKTFDFKYDKETVLNELKKHPWISGFTSWGPNIELELKPDIAAPGEDIYSTLNNNRYGVMSGTSMASPHIAASALLLQPKVTELAEKLGINKIDLTKILLMNTANPAMDYKTKGSKSDYLEASPRQQGAGVINLYNALETEVIAISESGEYPTGSISLREIGAEKTFKIKLKNFGKEDRTFTISNGSVMTSGVIKVEKMHADKKVEVNEIHSKEITGAKIITNKDEITVKAGEEIEVEFKLISGDIDNNFVEGYLYFNEKDGKHPRLVMPYMAFKGDWGKERILDAPIWDKDSRTKLTTVVHKVYEGDQLKYESLGILEDGSVDPDKIAMTNENTEAGSIRNVYPRIIPLRDAVELEMSVVDSKDPDAHPMLTLSKAGLNTKFLNSMYHESLWYKDGYDSVAEFLKWDGRKYDPKTGELEYVKEGQYYFRFKFRAKKDGEFQTTYLPIKVDNTDPKLDVKVIDNNGKKKVIINASDNVGVKKAIVKLDDKVINVTKVNDHYESDDFTLDFLTNNELSVEVSDFAGRKAKYNDSLQKSLLTYDKNLFKDISKEKENSIVLNVDDKVKKVEINVGEEKFVPNIENGKVTLSLENKLENNKKYEVKISLYDEENKVIGTDSNLIVRDKVAPKLEIDKSNFKEVDDEEIVESDVDGNFIVRAKVSDNVTDAKNLTVTYSPSVNQSKKITVPVDKDGNITLALSKKDVAEFINLQVKDEAGNVVSTLVWTEPWTDDSEEKDKIFIVRPLSNYLAANEEVIHHLGSPYSGSIKENNLTYDMRVWVAEGHSVVVTSINTTNNGKTKVSKKYTAEEDTEFEIPTPVEQGSNNFNVIGYDENDKEIFRRTIFLTVDVEGPEIELDQKVEELDEGAIDGYIYGNGKELKLSGKITENGDSWELLINKNVIESHYLPGENGSEKSFSHTIDAEEGDIVRITAKDGSGNEEELKLKVKVDNKKPNVAVNIEDNANFKKGQIVKPEIKVTDEGGSELKTTTILLNGKPYDNAEINEVGTYTLEIIAEDNAGNETRVVRKFVIEDDKKEQPKKDEANKGEQNNQPKEQEKQKEDADKKTNEESGDSTENDKSKEKEQPKKEDSDKKGNRAEENKENNIKPEIATPKLKEKNNLALKPQNKQRDSKNEIDNKKEKELSKNKKEQRVDSKTEKSTEKSLAKTGQSTNNISLIASIGLLAGLVLFRKRKIKI